MKELLIGLEQNKKEPNLDYINKLKQAGFENASKIASIKDYPCISEERIWNFLNSRCINLIEKELGKCRIRNFMDSEIKNNILECIKDVEKSFFSANYEARLRWIETPIGEYNNIPPLHVLEALEFAKDKFDTINVVTLEFQITKNSPLVDPLLIGRIKGNTNRYFISQWDNDLTLDDL